MLTTVEDVIRRVQRDYGDENNSQIQPSDIFDWINFGQLEIVRQTECLESEFQWRLDTVQPSDPYGTINYGLSGKYSLQLPGDFFKSQRVQVNTSWIEQTRFNDLVELDTGLVSVFGSPTLYAIRDTKLHLTPALALSAGSTNVVTLYYVRLPSPVTSVTDSLSIPANFVQDLIEYCLMKAKELGEDLQHAQLIGGRLTERLARTRDDGATREDSYDTIRDDYMDYNPYYGEY